MARPVPPMDILPETHRDAERLMITLKDMPLRAADALHHALALPGSALSVMTFDGRFAAAGLQVFPRPPRDNRRHRRSLADRPATPYTLTSPAPPP